MESQAPSHQNSTTRATPLWKKLLVVALVVTAGSVAYIQFRDTLTLQYLAAREAELRSLQQNHPLLVYGSAFLI